MFCTTRKESIKEDAKAIMWASTIMGLRIRSNVAEKWVEKSGIF
jgi:hypothetical protein